MPENDVDEQWTCDLCGQATSPPSGDGMSLDLEISGRQPNGEWGAWYVGFCSQAHAAEWLSRPLPAPKESGATDVPMNWTDRAALTGCVLVLVLLLGLVLLGAWTAWGFAIDRF